MLNKKPTRDGNKCTKILFNQKKQMTCYQPIKLEKEKMDFLWEWKGFLLEKINNKEIRDLKAYKNHKT